MQELLEYSDISTSFIIFLNTLKKPLAHSVIIIIIVVKIIFILYLNIIIHNKFNSHKKWLLKLIILSKIGGCLF